LVENGDIGKEIANNFVEFVGLNNQMTFNIYIYGKLGKLQHLENDPGY